MQTKVENREFTPQSAACYTDAVTRYTQDMIGIGETHMKLSFHEYLDKMRGCWNGKNIGGTLGTPFEGMRGLFDIQYYSQPLDKPLPNDDLDLQLVWLNAVEKYGRNINRELLGEYWLSFIYPDCAEYGAGKNNLRAGLVPPLSGYVGNHYPLRANTMLPALKYKPDQRVQCEKPHAQTIRSAFR